MANPKAVIYSRVSTDEQAKNGFSLLDQEEKLKKYCEVKGWEVVKHYQDDHSAKTFERPAFQGFLDDIKSKKISPTIFLCARPDRFSRDTIGGILMERQLNSLGIKVEYIEGGNYDDNVPESLLIKVIQHAIPEVENLRRSKNTRDGLRRAKKEGRWMGAPPKGYFLKDKLLVPNEDARYVVESFEEASLGLEPFDSIRLKMAKKGFKISKQQFYNMLSNPVYIGKVLVKAYGDEPEELVMGLHESLISEEMFEEVQKIRNKKKRQKFKPKKEHESLPLRGLIKCPKCGRALTGSTSTNRTKKGYHYYHCQKKYDCDFRAPANDVNDEFVKELNRISIPEEVTALYLEIVKDKLNESDKSRTIEIKRIEKDINEIDQKLISAEDMLIDKSLSIDRFKRITGRLEDMKEGLLNRKAELYLRPTNFDKYLEFGAVLISKLPKVYRESNVQIKRKIVGSIFDEKIPFDGKKYRTQGLSPVVDLFNLKIKDLQESQKKKASKLTGLSNSALPLGLEPRTL